MHEGEDAFIPPSLFSMTAYLVTAKLEISLTSERVLPDLRSHELPAAEPKQVARRLVEALEPWVGSCDLRWSVRCLQVKLGRRKGAAKWAGRSSNKGLQVASQRAKTLKDPSSQVDACVFGISNTWQSPAQSRATVAPRLTLRSTSLRRPVISGKEILNPKPVAWRIVEALEAWVGRSCDLRFSVRSLRERQMNLGRRVGAAKWAWGSPHKGLQVASQRATTLKCPSSQVCACGSISNSWQSPAKRRAMMARRLRLRSTSLRRPAVSGKEILNKKRLLKLWKPLRVWWEWLGYSHHRNMALRARAQRVKRRPQVRLARPRISAVLVSSPAGPVLRKLPLSRLCLRARARLPIFARPLALRSLDRRFSRLQTLRRPSHRKMHSRGARLDSLQSTKGIWRLCGILSKPLEGYRRGCRARLKLRAAPPQLCILRVATDGLLHLRTLLGPLCHALQALRTPRCLQSMRLVQSRKQLRRKEAPVEDAPITACLRERPLKSCFTGSAAYGGMAGSCLPRAWIPRPLALLSADSRRGRLSRFATQLCVLRLQCG